MTNSVCSSCWPANVSFSLRSSVSLRMSLTDLTTSCNPDMLPDVLTLLSDIRWLNFTPVSHFCSVMLCIARTVLSQDICLSIHLLVTRRYSIKTAKHILKLFFTVGSPPHSSFSVPNVMTVFRWGPPNGGIKCSEYEKIIMIFNHYLTLSQNTTRYSHSYYERQIGNHT